MAKEPDHLYLLEELVKLTGIKKPQLTRLIARTREIKIFSDHAGSIYYTEDSALQGLIDQIKPKPIETGKNDFDNLEDPETEPKQNSLFPFRQYLTPAAEDRKRNWLRNQLKEYNRLLSSLDEFSREEKIDYIRSMIDEKIDRIIHYVKTECVKKFFMGDYNESDGIAYQLLFLKNPFDQIKKYHYVIERYLSEEYDWLKDTKKDVTLDLIKRKKSHISYDDAYSLIIWDEEYKFVDRQFLKECFGTYSIGKLAMIGLHNLGDITAIDSIADHLEKKIAEQINNH